MRTLAIWRWGSVRALASIFITLSCTTDPTLPAGILGSAHPDSGSAPDGLTDAATQPDAAGSHLGQGQAGQSGNGGQSSNGGWANDAGAPDAGYGALDGGSCTPGVPRCHGDFGYQQCEQDGHWGAPHSCAGYSSNGTTSYCVTTLGTDGSEPWAACVDPACWYWITGGFIPGSTAVGICTSSTTINACNGGGTLSEATCDGVCTQVGVLDGRVLGYCRAECEAGARECIGGALYRSCDHGRWSAQASVCAGGADCNPLGTGSIPDIRCGGVCDPGTSRCADDGSGVEDCNDSGSWEAGQQCLLGACTPKGPQAECQAECSANQFQCAADGAGTQRSCNAQSLWDPATDCAAGSSCRISGGQALGCLACIGPKNAQGNAYGVSDSKCDAGGVSQCGDDNTWQAPVACASGQACVQLNQGVSSVAYCQPL